jgi:hypothetical protein
MKQGIKIDPEVSAILEMQRQAFVEKFGREPGPNDPVFFDPDADTPSRLTEKQLDEVDAELVRVLTASGVPKERREEFLRWFRSK